MNVLVTLTKKDGYKVVVGDTTGIVHAETFKDVLTIENALYSSTPHAFGNACFSVNSVMAIDLIDSKSHAKLRAKALALGVMNKVL